MLDYTVVFGDRAYRFKFQYDLIVYEFHQPTYGRAIQGLQGLWRVKKLKPTPNKSTVLQLAKTDSLI